MNELQVAVVGPRSNTRPFTDNDLRRLKAMRDRAKNAPKNKTITGALVTTQETLQFNQELIADFPALLVRLEAAEELVEKLLYGQLAYAAIANWRKAAGK